MVLPGRRPRSRSRYFLKLNIKLQKYLKRSQVPTVKFNTAESITDACFRQHLLVNMDNRPITLQECQYVTNIGIIEFDLERCLIIALLVKGSNLRLLVNFNLK